MRLKEKLKEDLKEKIKKSDILVSDLDDTDAPSPAKTIARDFLLKPSSLLKLKSYSWAIKFLKHNWSGYDKSKESELWGHFVDSFLRNPAELQKIKEKYTEEFVKSTFYPGVLDFYKFLPEEITKLYITRNIGEVAFAYMKTLGFDGCFAEEYNKRKAIERVVKNYPSKKGLFLKETPLKIKRLWIFLVF